MKTVSFRFAAVYLLILTVMLTMVIILVPAAHGVVQHKSDQIAQLAANQPIPEPKFVLRAYNGHLALWREGADRPYRILNAEIWLLSDEDLVAVQEGITVDTETELKRLLEDLDAAE